MAPSQLSIATGSVSRLVKEESYYRKELSQQKEKLAKEKQSLGPDADYNDNFMIKQMVCHNESKHKLCRDLLN